MKWIKVQIYVHIKLAIYNHVDYVEKIHYKNLKKKLTQHSNDKPPPFHVPSASGQGYSSFVLTRATESLHDLEHESTEVRVVTGTEPGGHQHLRTIKGA